MCTIIVQDYIVCIYSNVGNIVFILFSQNVVAVYIILKIVMYFKLNVCICPYVLQLYSVVGVLTVCDVILCVLCVDVERYSNMKTWTVHKLQPITGETCLNASANHR